MVFVSLSTREREQELYGPKKRGPKPKTLLLKVGLHMQATASRSCLYLLIPVVLDQMYEFCFFRSVIYFSFILKLPDIQLKQKGSFCLSFYLSIK